MDLFIRLVLIFGVGFLTWSLALVRTLAIIKQQVWLLCGLVFTEEVAMLVTGMWLARSGTCLDALSCALGGVVAAYLVMRKNNKHEGL